MFRTKKKNHLYIALLGDLSTRRDIDIILAIVGFEEVDYLMADIVSDFKKSPGIHLVDEYFFTHASISPL